MYLQNELLLTSPLIVYACFRLRSLIAPKTLRNISTGLFVLLAAGYPVAESLSHGAGDGWAAAAILVGYYSLPLLLYLVMTVVAVDLVVGLLRLAGAISRERVRSKRFRECRLAVCLAVPALVVVLGAVNHAVLRVRDYRVEVPRLSSTAEEVTVVFMADLHFRGLTSDRFLARLAARVNAQNPDIILVGGDILEGDRRDEDTGRYEEAFRRMTSRYGIFAVPGNHEGFSRTRADQFLLRAGIRLLQDETVAIDDAFILAGRKDARSRNRKSVADLLSAAPPGLPVILVAHRPTQFEDVRRAGVALQLSGHTHDGQLFPVNIVTRRQYELSRGHLEKGGSHLFVTSGVQGWGPPIRTVGASEILVIRVAFRGGPGAEKTSGHSGPARPHSD